MQARKKACTHAGERDQGNIDWRISHPGEAAALFCAGLFKDKERFQYSNKTLAG